MEADDLFAENTRRVREERRLTQGALAALLLELGVNLPQQTIYKIETGKRRVTVGEAVVIAEALDVNVMALMRGAEAYESAVASLKNEIGIDEAALEARIKSAVDSMLAERFAELDAKFSD